MFPMAHLFVRSRGHELDIRKLARERAKRVEKDAKTASGQRVGVRSRVAASDATTLFRVVNGEKNSRRLLRVSEAEGIINPWRRPQETQAPLASP